LICPTDISVLNGFLQGIHGVPASLIMSTLTVCFFVDNIILGYMKNFDFMQTSDDTFKCPNLLPDYVHKKASADF